MGRKSHNLSYQQMLEKSKKRALEYYYDHKDEVNKKRRDKYEKLKREG